MSLYHPFDNERLAAARLVAEYGLLLPRDEPRMTATEIMARQAEAARAAAQKAHHEPTATRFWE